MASRGATSSGILSAFGFTSILEAACVDQLASRIELLQVVNGAMALQHVVGEACLLERAIDVAGEHERAMLPSLRPPPHDVKALMRNSLYRWP